MRGLRADGRELKGLGRARETALAAGVTGTAAGLVASWHLTVPGIWRDEAVTAIVSTRTWPQIFATATRELDAVHATYYVAMKAWLGLVGTSPLTLRAPSVLAFAVAVGLLVVLGSRLGHLRVGVIGGIALACLPRAMWAAGEARGYSLALLFSVAIMLTAVLALTASRRWWFAYSAAVLLGAYVFLYLVLLVPAIALFVWGRRGPRRDWFRFAIATGVALVAVVPLVAIASRQTAQLYWVKPMSRETISMALSYQWVDQVTPWIAAVWWALAIAGLTVRWRARNADAWARGTVLALMGWLVIPTTVLIAFSIVSTPIYFYRYGVVSLAAMALAVAFAIDELGRWWLRVVALGALAAMAVAPVAEIRGVDSKHPVWNSELLEWVPGGGGRRGPTDAEWAWLANASLDLGVRAYLSDLPPEDAVIAIAGRGALAPYDGPVVVASPSRSDAAVTAARAALDGEGRRATVWSGLLPLHMAPEVLTEAERVWVVMADADPPAYAGLDDRLAELGFTSEPILDSSGGTVLMYSRR